ncbi:MAG: hypothetical protein Q7V09_16595 [Hydrogenophaga sp.]|uniref:hypothetical protein n=1 Tax=Hydrogenophaga sp. TaxID=1904254 RepID=UPI0027193C71|nr:hypothetical protein [Hydrogenophaga sp.]MDO9032046.1 hypothetical protein [Hydrogenophaga sp.]
MLKLDLPPVDIVKRFDYLWGAHSRMCANEAAYWSVEPSAIPLVGATTVAEVKRHNLSQTGEAHGIPCAVNQREHKALIERLAGCRCLGDRG